MSTPSPVTYGAIGKQYVQVWQGLQGTPPLEIINQDTVNTIYIGYSNTITPLAPNAIPVQPGDSVIIDGTNTVYAIAAVANAGPLVIIPGGTGYTAGSVTINGPVTATIDGPVTADLAPGSTVAISGTPTVDIGNSPAVSISGTPNVAISGTPTVDVTGTTDVQVQNATIDVIGSGGFILPGQVASLVNTGFSNIPAGGSALVSNFDVTQYQSLDFVVETNPGSTVAGAAYCVQLIIHFLDSTGLNILASKQIAIPMGGTFQFSLPCIGPKCNITLTNSGTSQPLTVSVLEVFGSFRPVSGFQWNTVENPVPPNDASLNWIPSNNPAGTLEKWLSSGGYSPNSVSVPCAVLLPPSMGLVNGFYQVVNNAFSNNVVVIDMSLQNRGGIVAGTANSEVLMNIPAAIASTPTLFSQNFPIGVMAIVMKSASLTSALQFTAVEQ